MSTLTRAYDAEQLRGDSFLVQLWRFARPHTVVGTTLSLVALWVLARGIFPASTVFANAQGGIGPVGTTTLLLSWVACIGANVYIVGLNQLTDIPLDRINKPYLPLASGAWSVGTGRVVVVGGLLLSLIAAYLVGSPWLWWTVALSLALGTAYSLPPLRLKRFNFWAAFCIIAVRSLIVNVLLFAHVANWQADVRDLPPPVWLLTFVMFAFSIAIAWFKDLPDAEGDAAHGVETLTVRLGRARMLRSGAMVLVVCLGLAAAAPLLVRMQSMSTLALVLGQLAILLAFVWSVRRVELSQKRSIRRFYLTTWGLFFGEYVLWAVAGWVG